MKRLPQSDGLTGLGGLFAVVEGESAVPAATGLEHPPSLAYVPKTRRSCANRNRRLVIGDIDRGQRANSLRLSSTKSLSFATVGLRIGRATAAMWGSVLLWDSLQDQCHGFSAEGTATPKGESNCTASRLRKGQTSVLPCFGEDRTGAPGSTEGSGVRRMLTPIRKRLFKRSCPVGSTEIRQ